MDIQPGSNTRKTGRYLIFTVLFIIMAGTVKVEASRYLVKDGEPVSVIVIQDLPENVPLEEGAVDAIRKVVDELQYHIKRATGVRLPEVAAGDLTGSGISEDHVRILIGPGEMTRSLLPDFDPSTSEAKDETYRMEYIDNHLVLTGLNPEPIQWSVYRFLDRYLGVRWLWPGEMGTYVPVTDNVTFPVDLSIIDQPPLEWRSYTIRPPAAVREESNQWQIRHMMGGDRSDLAVGHSFLHWWDTYSDEHPDLFAMERGDFTHRRVDGEIHYQIQLCFSNPKVDEFIIAEWKEAGKPDVWPVANNDLRGRHCLCDDCLAMDIPVNQSREDIWLGYGNMTARHVQFWIRLRDKMREIHPDITLQAYAFEDYRYAPPPGTDLEGIVVSFVGSYWAHDDWLAWQETGARMPLRPNWWWTGGVAPHIPLHAQGEFFKFAFDNGMKGFHFDTLMGYWGTQGSLYYLITRLAYRPDLEVEEVISEYTDAFGSAKPAIEEYLAFWEELTEKAKYPWRGGDRHRTQIPGKDYGSGLYETIRIEEQLHERVNFNNWLILPYMYPDEVTGEAHAILDRAELLAVNDGKFVQDRIRFLRDGLRYLEATREVFRLGYPGTRPDDSDETWRKYVQARENLETMQHEVISPHVLWWEGSFERQRNNNRAWRELWDRDN